MDKERFIDLHQRYLNRTISQAEFDELQLALQDEKLRNTLGTELDVNWSRPLLNTLSGERFERVYREIIGVSPARKRRLWIPVTIAAAVVTLAMFIYFFIAPSAVESSVVFRGTEDPVPGKDAATLILADGKKIEVSAASAGKLVDNDQVSITKTGDGQLRYEIKDNAAALPGYNTLFTANGQQIQLVLPDQSKVWLNSGSSLKYPASFANLKERKVELSGEAYFEVAKDKEHPFIVRTEDQQVKVLGTHFNVSAYPDEPAVKTTLAEGSVQIDEIYTLSPGQQAVNTHGKVSIGNAEVALETAWINNEFYFDEEDTESVMRKVARWYNMSVRYAEDDLKRIPLSGHISRTKTLGAVLRRIGKAAALRFVVEDDTIHIERD